MTPMLDETREGFHRNLGPRVAYTSKKTAGAPVNKLALFDPHPNYIPNLSKRIGKAMALDFRSKRWRYLISGGFHDAPHDVM